MDCYICEYMWRNLLKVDNEDFFDNILPDFSVFGRQPNQLDIGF